MINKALSLAPALLCGAILLGGPSTRVHAEVAERMMTETRAVSILSSPARAEVADPELTWDPPSPPAPSMVWAPAQHYRKGNREPEHVTAVVIHTTEGRYDSDLPHEVNQARNFRNVVRYFQNNTRNVSAHYVIGPNGEIAHMVNDTDVAHTQTYYNGRSIGIECAGWGRRPETWTPEMMDALVDLTAYLCVKWEIPAYHPEGTAYESPFRVVLDEDNERFTGPGLVGHFQVQPWNKSDPGAHFDWDEFGERVRERIREYGVEPIALPAPEEVDEVVHATARVKEDTVTAGEPFTYELTIRGEDVDAVTLDDIIFPAFDVHSQLEVHPNPVRAHSSPERVVYEVTLTSNEAGSMGLSASRVLLHGHWIDSQPIGVRVGE